MLYAAYYPASFSAMLPYSKMSAITYKVIKTNKDEGQANKNTIQVLINSK